MSRFRVVPLAVTLLTAACKVAPTPREYFDHQTPAAVERQAVAEEVQDRILAMGQALNRGNTAEAMIALAPAPDVYLITPRDSAALQGPDAVGAALQGLAGAALEIGEVQVQVGPRQNVAWFHAVMARPGGEADDGAPLRLSGVYVRNEGAWQLVQGHLSRATPSASPPSASPAPAADSAGGG